LFFKFLFLEVVQIFMLSKHIFRCYGKLSFQDKGKQAMAQNLELGYVF